MSIRDTVGFKQCFILGKTLPETCVLFLTPSLLLFPCGQDDGIKDCINQGLSERDSSSRLAEGGRRRVATLRFEEEEWQSEEEVQPELASCERDASSGYGFLGRICRWRREMTQKNNGQTIRHRGSYTSLLLRVSSNC